MGKYRCPGCDYTYDEAQGDPHEGCPPAEQHSAGSGTRFLARCLKRIAP